jgi:hypothetical protein
MNPDAFEGSETVTVERFGDALRYTGGEPASIPIERLSVADFVAAHPEYAQGAPLQTAIGHEAMQDTRLKACGLVQYDCQLSSKRWIAPAGRRFETRTQVLPLFMVKPKPNMEIEALDGEKYLLPADFQGDWFDVVSDLGRRLIP